jgi:hypothetical protein
MNIKTRVSNVVKLPKTLIYGRDDYAPAAKQLISKYGDQTIKSIQIVRNPLSQVLQTTLNVLSEKQPYDKLYHLALYLTLDNVVIAYEKTENLKITENPKMPKDGEVKQVVGFTPTTLSQFLENTKTAMGSKYFPYDSYHNTCQDFVIAALHANGVTSNEYDTFVKQETRQLFSDNLRSTARVFTDIGARANILMQGGKLHHHHQIIIHE